METNLYLTLVNLSKTSKTFPTLPRCGLGKFCSFGKCKQKEGTPCRGNFPGFLTDNPMEGCNDATEAYCPDLSDIRPCPRNGSLTCDEDIFFRCTDNHFCIHKSLVCDGDIQVSPEI